MPDITETLLASLSKMDASAKKLDTTLDSLTKSLQSLVKQSSKSVDVMEERRETMKELEELSLDELAMKKKGRKLSDEEMKLAKEMAVVKREVMDQEKHLMKLKAKWAAATGDEKEKLNKTIRGGETKLALMKENQAKTASKGLGQFSKELKFLTKILKVGLMWILGSIIGEYVRYKDAITTTTGMLEGSLGPSFADAQLAMEKLTWSTGLAYEEMLKSVKANRQVVSAMGGTIKATEMWTGDVKDAFVSMTGDVDTAFALMLESQNSLRIHGFVPTTKAILGYTQDIKKLAGMTNLATAEIASLYNEVASDTDSLILLKAAREDERGAIIAGQRAMINLNVAAGMTAEQAKSAAKMLNKMVAAKPLERIKQAAKIRALGGAMGVAGADEAAQAVMAGPRASAEQKKQLEGFSKSMTNMMDQSRGQGLGSEIFATTLLDKLDLEQYYGSDSSFSTTLIKALKNQAGDMVDAMNDSNLGNMITFQESYNKVMAKLSGESVGLLREISTTLNIIKEFFSGFKDSFVGQMMGFGGGGERTEQIDKYDAFVLAQKKKTEEKEYFASFNTSGPQYDHNSPENVAAREDAQKARDLAERQLAAQEEANRIAAEQKKALETFSKTTRESLAVQQEGVQVSKDANTQRNRDKGIKNTPGYVYANQ